MGTVAISKPLTGKILFLVIFTAPQNCIAEGMLTAIPTLQVQCGFLRYHENCAPFLFHSL